MSLRLLAALVVAVLFGLAQLLPVTGTVASRSDQPLQAIGRLAPSTVHAQDDEDNDDDEDDSDNDDADDDSDNDDADDDSDNDDADDASDNDDTDDDSDNDDDDGADDSNNDNGSTAAAIPPPPAVDATLPATEATGTSTGGDVVIRLGGERVVVSMFPWTPSGVTVVVKRVEPAQVAAAPGMRAGDLLFSIEARDNTGQPMTTLPDELNLSVRYNEADVTGLNESNLSISRLDSLNNQWVAAPKQARNADGNYIAATISDPGTYTVHTP